MVGLVLKYDFKVKMFDSREEMGEAAAEEAGAYIGKLLEEKEEINCIFAAAPSQNEFLKYLTVQNIGWTRVNAFHMDEYIGLKKGDSRLFSIFLYHNIFSKVPFKKVYSFFENGRNVEDEMARYTELITLHPVDITFMGIGENGHIAFNDPHAADFNDSCLVKSVELDQRCREQQVNDGCFETLDEVPRYALTLTVPALLRARKIFCIVPSLTKAEAVKNTVLGEISEKCPASILRKHMDSSLYIDKDSGKYLI